MYQAKIKLKLILLLAMGYIIKTIIMFILKNCIPHTMNVCKSNNKIYVYIYLVYALLVVIKIIIKIKTYKNKLK